MKKNAKKIFGLFFITVLTVLTVMPMGQIPANAQVSSGGSLFIGGSFEQSLDKYWQVWKAPNSARTYEFFRSYESAHGQGSYSAAIQASGGAEDMFMAGMVANSANNAAMLSAGGKYIMTFYAKSTANTNMIVYLQRADTYEPISDFREVLLTDKWKRYVVDLNSTYSGSGLAGFVFGNMPNGSILTMDGIYFFPNNLKMTSPSVDGFIGDKKALNISNIGNFNLSDIEIELPYYNNLTGSSDVKRFAPDSMNKTAVNFTMPGRTYSGIGRIYIGSIHAGDFNYNVKPRLVEYYPNRVRADEDLTLYGTGFMPSMENSYLVLKTKNIEEVLLDSWTAPHIIDSELKQATYRLPVGVSRGSMYIVTSYIGIDGRDVVNKSNTLAYEVKPVIYNIEWEKRGFDQVGNRVVITGKGISDRPSVIFYNDQGVRIDTQKAQILEISDKEVIVAQTTTKSSIFNVTVKSGNVESDLADALNFSAKPRLEMIKTAKTRDIYSSSDKMPAAAIGETILLSGVSLSSGAASSTVHAEFEGYNERILVKINAEDISKSGNEIKVIVPEGAQNGYVKVLINEQSSNYLPIEIIPSIISISPDPVQPGEELLITAYGVGDNVELARVMFNEGKTNEITVRPDAINMSGNVAHIYLRAPMAISNQSTGMVLKYDKWSSNGSYKLSLSPTITGVSMNTDTGMLVIRGYGFSINPKENVITYKYADEAKTVITPKVKVLGVYPTEEGQEIRINVSDNYHYGYVSVNVGGQESNEVNFGPVSVSKIARRIEFVKSENRVMGVLYISGYNFGSEGGVKVGNNWADVHYRSEFFVIAVVEKENVYDNPVVVARPR
jgi:hypothetical protein